MLNQSVALKFGRRISQSTVVVIVQALNNLVQKQGDKLIKLPVETRAELSETMALLYYFKHSAVLQIYQKSKVDFATAKSAFTTGIFNLAKDDSETSTGGSKILQAFYSLVFQRPESITTRVSEDEDSLNVDKILRLKQSGQVTQFSEESH